MKKPNRYFEFRKLYDIMSHSCFDKTNDIIKYFKMKITKKNDYRYWRQ